MLALIFVDLPAHLQLAGRLLMAALCLLIIVASVCRVAAMQAGKSHRWSWAVCYTLYGVAAGDMLIFLAQTKAPPHDAAALAITALAANVWLTRKSWPNGKPPKITEKP